MELTKLLGDLEKLAKGKFNAHFTSPVAPTARHFEDQNCEFR
jgi:hypothetical protein